MNPETKIDRAELRERARAIVVEVLAGGTVADTRHGRYQRLSRSLGETRASDLIGRSSSALYDLTSTRDDLLQKIAGARTSLDDAARFVVGERARFNSLGILQGDGPAIDRLCGLFDIHVRIAVQAEHDVLVAEAELELEAERDRDARRDELDVAGDRDDR